jgi:CO dehydrogenase maturation factor
MTQLLAICGKGGTGKTSVSALFIRSLKQRGHRPILAVDADPNSNLAPALGLEEPRTLGQVREEFMGTNFSTPPGMTKQDLFEYKLNAIVEEGEGVDLLVMGRPEGPGCYCFINNLLRDQIERMSESYKVVVVDNEAGLEHLSRRTTTRIDILLLVSDASVKGVRALARVRDLADEMKIKVGRFVTIINRVPEGGLPQQVVAELERLRLEAAALIPEDGKVLAADLDGKSLLELTDNTPAARAVDDLVGSLL